VKLPAAERAVVDPPKVRDYLLSDQHPIGRFKSVFFKSLGYSGDAWEELRRDLHALAQAEEATLGEGTEYGQKYEIRGTLKEPVGRSAAVRTVWIIRWEENAPRFVTAFPGERR